MRFPIRLRLRKLGGALVLIGTAALYGGIALVRGHSAAAEPPPDLSAPDAPVDVWRGLALLAAPANPAALLDLRSRERFELYHLRQAENLPGAGARAIAERARSGRPVLLIADKDEAASALIGEARRLAPGAKLHFVQEGARALYLALELPVPLFAEAPAPFGYEPALDRVRAWLRAPGTSDRGTVIEAIGQLSRAAYAPTALQSRRKASSGPARKKISGGCG